MSPKAIGVHDIPISTWPHFGQLLERLESGSTEVGDEGMLAKRLTPILNVSNIQESFAWFEKLGWKKAWDWGTPADFGGVCSGEYEIFLCENAQGSRGKSSLQKTFGPEGDDSADKGVWMMI